MQYPSYIPAPDALFDNWLRNFSEILTSNPTGYGLLAADATAVSGAYSTWHSSFGTATDPSTRTSATIADKDTERANAEALVRPLAVSIINNASVTNMEKVAIGVTVPSTVPTPIPAPTTSPTLILQSAQTLLHTMQYRDSSAPLVKAKPFGVVSLELYAQVGVTAGIDPDAATYLGNFNKTPFQVQWPVAQRAKHSTYWARWVTRSGPAGVPQKGPWSDALDLVIL
jgi:hypothetical protein